MKILGAALGNCVHVSGAQSFLDMAKAAGHQVLFLGPAVPVKRLVDEIRNHDPDLVALSYRLTPETAEVILNELMTAIESDSSLKDRRFVFGGTPPVAEVARRTGLFEAVFEGGEPSEKLMAVLGAPEKTYTANGVGEDLLSRIQSAQPMPLIRHHFGLPTMKATLEGAKKIAEASVLDILSIAPDQNAQESFFRPTEMNPKLDGSGGAPIRTREDLEGIYAETRTGNRPLLRCYSGTRDLVKWGEMLETTIKVAWGAVPLTWYSELDGRSSRTLREAIEENQEAIRWYADHGVPVEVNESHQWALRKCGDTVELATAYIAAYNAKKLGVRNYIAQFMFDTPRGISPAMDIAKMFAKQELIESLAGDGFRVIRMVRTGLTYLSTKLSTAKGQLASSICFGMTLKPHIVHVVGYSEADHAASADEIIESCEIARGVIGKGLLGIPRPEGDPAVLARKNTLLAESRFLIDAVKRHCAPHPHDPLVSPEVLEASIRGGTLDAADLKGGPVARGRIAVRMVDGACVAVDEATGTPLSEKERIARLATSEEDLDLAEI